MRRECNLLKKLLQAGVSADIVASTLNLSKNELERLIQA